MNAAELRIENLVAGYGPTVVLDGVTLHVPAGGTLAVLGHNGGGKTTLLATIMGLTDYRAGRIFLDGTPIEHMPIHRRAQAGLGFVPQERDIFVSLTVRENLDVCLRPGGWEIEQVYDLFPPLRIRRANLGNRLSGGEQQMLAIGRALVGAPRILLLDEPMEGLAPILVDALYDGLTRIRDAGEHTIILVEQKAELALEFARDAAVLDRGKVMFQGPSVRLLHDEALKAELLGVGARAV